MTIIIGCALLSLVILLACGAKLPPIVRYILLGACLPLFAVVLFYSLILGCGLAIGGILFFQYQRWRKPPPKRDIEIIYYDPDQK
jgi:hypothetical protein